MKLKHKKIIWSTIAVTGLALVSASISSCTLLDKLYPTVQQNEDKPINQHVEALEKIFNIPSIQENKTNIHIPEDTKVEQRPKGSLTITKNDGTQTNNKVTINDIKKIEYDPNIPLSETKNNKVLGQLDLKLENGANLLANIGIRLMLEEFKKHQGLYEVTLTKENKIEVSEQVISDIKQSIKKYAHEVKNAKNNLPKQVADVLEGDYIFGLYINIFHNNKVIQSPKILDINFRDVLNQATQE
ncbi:hypothetical protein JM47_01385 [Ureaplasma diversum]|uniref:Lipoprotein n=2 Tax=Ureaplasma diversum TaxID=42094 RepID=A0A084F1J1_9BACT|nr:hypothetical protein [Ureaplasma diversum]AJQ45268.1 hypothetical protein JM47_01385 [Ureaplasma diversum]KEZ24083.1 Hypothetical protein, predicted lipopotein [Ureaplasma diversum NCTC 246]